MNLELRMETPPDFATVERVGRYEHAISRLTINGDCLEMTTTENIPWPKNRLFHLHVYWDSVAVLNVFTWLHSNDENKDGTHHVSLFIEDGDAGIDIDDVFSAMESQD